MTDWQNAFRVARRMTLIEWTHGILIMAFLASATITVYGIGGTP
jgi:hypothetical protein